MDLKQSLRFQLEHVRSMTNGVLAEFESRDQWLFQVHPQANNAIWVLAHLALADNYMMKFIVPENDHRPSGYEPLFWFGSEPTNDDSKLPAVEELQAYFVDRRTNLMNILDEVSLEKMAEPVPPGSSFSRFPNLGHIFMFNTLHEGIHFGQLTVCHRGLGKSPLRK